MILLNGRVEIFLVLLQLFFWVVVSSGCSILIGVLNILMNFIIFWLVWYSVLEQLQVFGLFCVQCFSLWIFILLISVEIFWLFLLFGLVLVMVICLRIDGQILIMWNFVILLLNLCRCLVVYGDIMVLRQWVGMLYFFWRICVFFCGLNRYSG